MNLWLTTKRKNRSRWRWIGRVQKVHKSMKKAVQVLTLAWFVFIYGGGESASTPCTSDNFRYSKNFDVKSNT